MPSRLLLIAVAGLGLVAQVAFAADHQQGDGRGYSGPNFVLIRRGGPSDNDNIVFMSPQAGVDTTCLQGFGAIECRSSHIAPDPEDCPTGESLIKLRQFGYLRHVCASK